MLTLGVAGGGGEVIPVGDKFMGLVIRCFINNSFMGGCNWFQGGSGLATSQPELSQKYSEMQTETT